MNRNFRHSLVFIGIYLMGLNLHAQVELSEEDQDLKFQSHFFEALKQKAIKNYKKAIVSLENCMEIDGSNTAVFFEFSKNHLLLNNYQEAEIFIDMALEKEPNSTYLLVHKVGIFKAQQQFTSAIKIQEELVKTAPEQLNELVRLYLQNQEFEKARKAIENIENIGYNSQEIQGYKSFLENRGDSARSTISSGSQGEMNLEKLKSSFATSKEFSLLIKILNLEFEQKLFEELYKDSKFGLEIYPTQPIVYHWNAVALNHTGKYKEAIAVLNIGIDFVIDNKQMEIHFYEAYSKAYKGLGDTQKEGLFLNKAKELRKEI